MTDANNDGLLGRLAVHYKLVTLDQLNEITKLQARRGSEQPLGQLLVAKGLINAQQLEQLIKVQRDYVTKQAGAKPSSASSGPVGGPVAGVAAAAVAEMAAKQSAAKADQHKVVSTPAAPASRPVAPATITSASAAASATAMSASTVAPATATSASPVASASPALASGRSSAAPMSAITSASGKPTPRPSASPIENLLTQAVRDGASDIHLHSGAPVRYRVNGAMRDVQNDRLSKEAAEDMMRSILTDEQLATLAEKGQVDFAYTLKDVGRFRGNAYRQQRGTDMVLRAIPALPPTLAQLGLPSALAKFTNYHQGLVLLTGPAGCGKSSSLAALVNIINEERRDHIITVEDPIEYVHTPKRCSVNQRQVGPHTASFARALRAALREDPDIIAIGELRDLETISLALTAAETGHLVLATLHTNNAIRTINRLLGAFPPEQQNQIRTMVSESLRAVVSQRLIPRADGKGRALALEILVVNKAVGNLIRENKTFQIRSAMQTGQSLGMVLLDDALRELVKNGTITREEAMKNAEEPAKLKG